MTAEEFLALPKVANDAAKVGDRLVADHGFTCIKDGAVLVVGTDGGTADSLYVRCGGPRGKSNRHDEKHYLSGQFGDDGFLVGLRRAPEVTA